MAVQCNLSYQGPNHNSKNVATAIRAANRIPRNTTLAQQLVISFMLCNPAEWCADILEYVSISKGDILFKQVWLL